MFYIACFAGHASGGTELLHQLGRKIIDFGGEAKIFYVGNSRQPVPPRFEKYAVPFVVSINGVKDGDVLVVPETMTELIYKYKNMIPFIWWLSVDFYFARGSFMKRLRRFVGYEKPYVLGRGGVHHLAQSHYAMDFLRRNRESKVFYLSDFLGNEFFERAHAACSGVRVDRVLYNPKKGVEFTKKLMEESPEIEFVPIQNMAPRDVADLMSKSKVYIDFGEHPGKDRIPREAAVCGCCIITGKNGSAAFYDDVPIDEEYKFHRSEENIPAIKRKINQIFLNYVDHSLMFDSYRRIVDAEEAGFDVGVKAVMQFVTARSEFK